MGRLCRSRKKSSLANSFLLYRKLRFWVAKKEHMVIEHMLDKHVFGHDNKTLAGSEDIETFFAKTIVKWIIFI